MHFQLQKDSIIQILQTSLSGNFRCASPKNYENEEISQFLLESTVAITMQTGIVVCSVVLLAKFLEIFSQMK